MHSLGAPRGSTWHYWHVAAVLLDNNDTLWFMAFSRTSSFERSCSTLLTAALNTEALLPATAEARRQLPSLSNDFSMFLTYRKGPMCRRRWVLYNARIIFRASTNNALSFLSCIPCWAISCLLYLVNAEPLATKTGNKLSSQIICFIMGPAKAFCAHLARHTFEEARIMQYVFSIVCLLYASLS